MLLGVILVLSLLIGLVICGCAGAFGGFGWLWVLPVSFLGSVLALLAAAFLFLLWLCSRVDQNVPQEEDDPFYRKVVDLYVESIMPLVRIHVKTKGLEKTPKDGRFLLVCNHTSNADPIILIRYFRKSQLAFISKRENRDMFVVGKMMHKLQCQLINRENDREALKTVLKCIQILKEDKASVAVFPEGYIHNDLLFHEFRNGVFKIAQKAEVPIVVCTLKNTAQVIPNLLHFRRSDVELSLLEVIPAAELKGVTTVQIGDRIHKLMADDLGPDRIAK